MTSSTGVANEAAGSSMRSRLLGLFERLALVVGIIVLVAIFGAVRPEAFLSWANISTMLGSQSVLVVLTMALIIPLTSGDFDLSIAANLTLSAMVMALLNAKAGWPLGVVIPMALCVGVVTGIVNASIILYFRIPSLIVTLGTGTFINGIVLWISGSMTISGLSPELVKWVIVTRIFGIPLAFYYSLGLCFAIWYLMDYTPLGRRLLFVGRSREVARLSGIRVTRIRFGALVASGVLSSVAGVLYVGTIGAADPLSGNTFLLPAFAAAFLGATSIVPGRFNAWGSLFAVYFLVVGITGLTILGIQTYVQNLFYGGALVVAVALSQLARGREPQEIN